MARCWSCCQENCTDCGCSCHNENKRPYESIPLHERYSSSYLFREAELAKQKEDETNERLKKEQEQLRLIRIAELKEELEQLEKKS